MRKRLGILLFALAAGLCCWRYWSLNAAWPPPQERFAEMGDPLEYDGLTFVLESWQWSDGSSIKQMLPDYILFYDENVGEYPPKQIKVAYVTLSIANEGNSDASFDVTDASFESGAWGNQWDLEAYNAVNGTYGMLFELKPGDVKEVIIPLTFLPEQFHAYQWETLEQREFRAVLANYPEKVFLRYQQSG